MIAAAFHVHVTNHAAQRYRERVNRFGNPVKAIQNAVLHSGECSPEEARRRYGKLIYRRGIIFDSGSFLIFGDWEKDGRRFVVRTVWCP